MRLTDYHDRPNKCLLCHLPLRISQGGRFYRQKHNRDVMCRLTHPECLTIIKEFRKGRYRAYLMLLSVHGLRNEYGIPIGNFPMPIVCHDVVRSWKRKAERRRNNTQWVL